MALLPNQDDVQDGSGLIGWESILHNRIPPELKTSTTGGATATAEQYGINLSCGTTAGDVSYLLDFDTLYAAEGLRKHTVEGLLRQPNNQPTDDVEIGQLTNDGVNVDGGAYIDLTTKEFHVGSQTQTFNFTYTLDIKHIKVVIDYEAGETRFYIGSNNDSASGTIPAVSDNRLQHVAGIKSNGNGDSIQLMWMRQRMEPYRP